MTIVTSKVAICNLALGLLKIKPIVSIDTPNTNEEKICAQYYDIARQSVLQGSDWSFAIKRAALAEDTVSPVFGWTHQSGTFPSDFLKLISLHDSNTTRGGGIIINNNNEVYEVEGNRILTERVAPYFIKYLADIQDVNKFDRLFVTNLYFALATLMGGAFKTSSTRLQLILDVWRNVWEDSAKAVNAQQTNIVRVTRAPYVTVRRSPRGIGISNLNLE